MKSENETNFRWDIEKRIALSEIGNRTIQKQFIANYHDTNPYAIAKKAIEAYNEFCADISKAYITYGSVKLSRYLCEAHEIVVSEKTILNWLKDHGVTIQQPTRGRERLPRTTWEKNLYDKIENLESKLKEGEKQKEIEIQSKDETIDVLRKQRNELVDENGKLRVEVGRLMRVVGTLKYQK
jgi:hypothetical protein